MCVCVCVRVCVCVPTPEGGGCGCRDLCAEICDLRVGMCVREKRVGENVRARPAPSLPALQFPGMQQTALLIHVQNLCHEGKRNESHKCQFVFPPPCQNKTTTKNKSY